MTAVDRPDNGQDECPHGCGGTGVRQFDSDGWEACPHLIAEVASGRAGAGEQQREQVARWLRERVPLTTWQRDLRTYALSPAQADRIADELLALLGGPQPDEGCTCHLRVEVAGYCPVHEPKPCPVYSDGTNGWHCAVTGDHDHDQHTNAAGDVTW